MSCWMVKIMKVINLSPVTLTNKLMRLQSVWHPLTHTDTSVGWISVPMPSLWQHPRIWHQLSTCNDRDSQPSGQSWFHTHPITCDLYWLLDGEILTPDTSAVIKNKLLTIWSAVCGVGFVALSCEGLQRIQPESACSCFFFSSLLTCSYMHM